MILNSAFVSIFGKENLIKINRKDIPILLNSLCKFLIIPKQYFSFEVMAVNYHGVHLVHLPYDCEKFWIGMSDKRCSKISVYRCLVQMNDAGRIDINIYTAKYKLKIKREIISNKPCNIFNFIHSKYCYILSVFGQDVFRDYINN